jgi:hypothetical protein
MTKKEFIDYVWSFYAPNEIYGHFFNHTLTMGELIPAIELRMQSENFASDSVDRELIRDILLLNRTI